MCYHLYLASPLTLSEVRSMLPEGLRADLVEPAEQRALKRVLPTAQTGCRIAHGACSCDLVVRRHPVTREDESGLRHRYRELGLSRDQIIAALEAHRRGGERPVRPEGHWPRAIAGFVSEHARNAGPSLYYLGFSHDAKLGEPGDPASALAVSAAEVTARPEAWLPEQQLVLVQ